MVEDIGGRQLLMEDYLFAEYSPLWKTTLVEDELWWKITLGGRRPSVKDDLWWKTTLVEDDLRWKTSVDFRNSLDELKVLCTDIYTVILYA